jgi:hypothetical protein
MLSISFLDFQTQQSLSILEEELMETGLQLAMVFEFQISKGWA